MKRCNKQIIRREAFNFALIVTALVLTLYVNENPEGSFALWMALIILFLLAVRSVYICVDVLVSELSEPEVVVVMTSVKSKVKVGMSEVLKTVEQKKIPIFLEVSEDIDMKTLEHAVDLADSIRVGSSVRPDGKFKTLVGYAVHEKKDVSVFFPWNKLESVQGFFRETEVEYMEKENNRK